MRRRKRCLLFLEELEVIVAGLLVSGTLTILAAFLSLSQVLFTSVFCSGLLATATGFFFLRARHGPWKITYDAARWEFERVERRLHPSRARFKRIAWKILICLPSALAAFVLFFFPVSTHLVHVSSRCFGPFYIPVPWTETVLAAGDQAIEAYLDTSNAGRFGITPFRGVPVRFSLLGFGAEAYVLNFIPYGAVLTSATEVRMTWAGRKIYSASTKSFMV